MKNLSVENIYTREIAKRLTKKNFWRLLGMMLLTGVLVTVLAWGGTVLVASLTGAQWVTDVQPYSYETYVDPATMGAAFFGGFVVLMLVLSLLGTGLNLGLLRAMTDIAREQEKVPVSRVFSRMKYCLKGFGLGIWVGFKTMLWALPALVIMFFVTGSILVAGDPETMQVTESTIVLMSVLPLLMMVLIFALIIPATLRYFLSIYVLADEPSTGVFECVRKSKTMMKGHKWQLFKLTIPYLLKIYGWMFLILLAMMAVMLVMQQLPSEAASIIAIVVMVAAYVFLLWKLLTYTLRSQIAYCVFYLKRKGEMPAIPPEEEERIVCWQPGAEVIPAESIVSDAASVNCWQPSETKQDE